MELVLGLLMATAAAAFVFAPLVLSSHRTAEASGESADDLLSERENLYQAITDLDSDYAVGKIDDEDYEGLRAAFEVDAIAVLHRLDGLRGPDALAAAPVGDDPLEAEIAAFARKRSSSSRA